MTSALQRLVSDHADRASIGQRLHIFPLPEGGHILAYEHRAGHHHLISDVGREPEISVRFAMTEAGPAEAIAFLRRLLVSLEGRALAPLHTVVLSPPVFSGSPIVGAALVADPELGARVVQAVGITAREARHAVRSSTEAIVGPLRERDPWLVTLPHRDEILAATPAGMPVSEGHEVPTLQWSPRGTGYEVVIEPPRFRATLVEALRSRLPIPAPFFVRGPERTLRFEPAPEDRAQALDDELRVGLSAATLGGLALDPGLGPLTLGPLTLQFVDEPAAALPPLGEPVLTETEPLRPSEARLMAEEAAARNRLAEALALIPLAVRDGSHGLLAELLHIDVLRRLGRTADARAQLFETADAWLGGARPRVWNTQWRRLLELAKKLKLDAADPRLIRARELAR